MAGGGSSDADFTYHGDDDVLDFWQKMFTSRVGDCTGNHEESFLADVRLVAACKAGGRFLDVGTGYARIVDAIEPFAERIVSLEPDRERFLACQPGFRGRRIDAGGLQAGG